MYHARTKDHRGRGTGRRGTPGHFRGRDNHMRSEQDVLPPVDTSQSLITSMTENHYDLALDEDQDLRITGVEYVSSYNWIDTTPSTVLIPGLPAKWLLSGSKVQIRRDSDQYFRDPNAARFPNYPIEPAVASIFHTRPQFETARVKLFGCASTLGSLQAFASGIRRSFRFGVELIGNTMFLIRKTNTPTQLIEDVCGYGHNFADAYTEWDHAVRGSTSHQRIISYDFCGFKCLMRFECDGYLPEKAALNTNNAPEDRSTVNELPANIEDAYDDLNDLRINPTLTGTLDDKLNIRPLLSTQEIPQTAVFDLKTRSIGTMGQIKPQEFASRLWLNQTPNLVLAFHKYGCFEEDNIQFHDMREEIRKWEQLHQMEIMRMRGLIDDLHEHSRNVDGARLEVRRTDDGPLEIWTCPPGWQALPGKWRQCWLSTQHNDVHHGVQG